MDGEGHTFFYYSAIITNAQICPHWLIRVIQNRLSSYYYFDIFTGLWLNTWSDTW